jgi:monoamine oxidase
MREHDADVIIIGAGAAGLACAEVLADAGKSVIILEARHRVGGRILTYYDEREHFPIELGAEFVHGEHPLLMKRIERAQLRLRRINEEPWCKESNGLQKCGEFWTQTEKILHSLRRSKRDQSFAQFLKSPKGRGFSEDARDSATRYVEGFNAARAGEISVNSIIRGLKTEEKINGDKQFRIVNGYAGLVADMLFRAETAGVQVRTASEVKAVRWRKDRVEVQLAGTKHSLVARQCVITLPLGVLQAGSVKFTPVLPRKQGALKKLRMGEIIRVALRFRERFWEDIRPQEGGATLRRMGFLFSQDPVFPTWWTQRPMKEPLLIAWSPSWHTRTITKRSSAEQAKRALKSLASILDLSEKDLRSILVEAHMHDWQADPFCLGAYSYVKRGGEPAQKEMARPEAATLFFAGEAVVADGSNGTVHGALQSGSTAACKVLNYA